MAKLPMSLMHKLRDKEILPWIMWGMTATAFLTVIFHRSALAVVLDYLIRDFQIADAAVAGALVGMYATMYMIMQIPGGLLADFWGPRKTITTGMFVACAGSLVFALAPNLFMAFLGRGLVGLGVSVIFVSILKFQITWFKPTQFATISGLTGLTGNLGGIIATTPLAFLVTAAGWRNSFILVALVSFCIAILCWIIIRDSRQYLDGSYEEIAAGDRIRKASITGIIEALKVVFINKNTWYLFFTSFGLAGCLMAFSGSWSIPYLMQIYGFSRTHSANFMMAAILGKIVGFPLIGYLSDRFVRRKAPLLIFYSIHILLWFVLYFWSWGKPPVNGLMPIFFFMGLSSGAMMLSITLAKEVNQPSYAGTAMSVVNIAPFLGVSCIQPLLGYALELRWDGFISMGVKVYPLAAYRLLFAVCLAVLLISFCFALQIKEAK